MSIYECNVCHRNYSSKCSLFNHQTNIHHFERKGQPYNTGGRPKGSKNKNPYPVTETKLLTLEEQKSARSWSGKKHKPETLEKMSQTRNEGFETGRIKLVGPQKGRFRPTQPSKYKGNPSQICYRSSWEWKAMIFFDTNSNVLSWSSEEIALPYFDKASGRYRNYFPDFVITLKHEDGSIKTVMVEIKPAIQIAPPRERKQNTKSKTYLWEVTHYATNISKWEAAKLYCEKKGWEFRLMDEYALGIKKRKK